MTGFTEVGREVYVLRYPVLDVNATLVVGDGAALLVDTLSTGAQARELVEAARAVTPHPWQVVNTHHHFDHCFGNAVVAAGGRPVWAHEEAARQLTHRAEVLRREAYAQFGRADPGLGAALLEVEVQPPDRTVHQRADLEVGGRPVVLRHLGRGHSAGDLVVQVPDADVLVAGDLVEESGPPDFGDAFPLEWPETVAELLTLTGPGTVVVPGHGAPVDRGFVTAQHAELTTLAWRIREGHADGAPAGAVAATAPYRSETAVRRGYAALSGVA